MVDEFPNLRTLILLLLNKFVYEHARYVERNSKGTFQIPQNILPVQTLKDVIFVEYWKFEASQF